MADVTTFAELQTAIAAYDNANVTAATISVSSTLAITAHVGTGIRGLGPGLSIASGSPGCRTTLTWTGAAGGTMILADQWGAGFIENIALDGANSAAVGVKITESASFGTSQLLFRRLAVRNCTTAAFDIGVDGQPNCSDMCFDNVWLYNCGIGLRVNNEQGLNYYFNGGGAQSVGTIFDFVKGGNLCVVGAAHYGGFDWMLRVRTGGPNARIFRFEGVRAEMGGYTKRYARILDANPSDQCHIVVNGLQETDFLLNSGLTNNIADSKYSIGPGALVEVNSSSFRIGSPVRVNVEQSGGMLAGTNNTFDSDPAAPARWTRTGGKVRLVDCYKTDGISKWSNYVR
jgi:hypothetical protein